MEIIRTKQCGNCPWKKDSNLDKIPEYDRLKHLDLATTIAEPGSLDSSFDTMGCHESFEGDELCVGWLVNQIGVGNNIPLRIRMMQCSNAKDLEVFGEQFQTFEEMLR